MKKTGKNSLPAGILSVLALLLADQLTKFLARTYLAGGTGITVIPGVFELYYLENRGAAFGMLANHQIIFVVIAAAILILTGYVYRKLPARRRYSALRAVCVLIAAGAAGNMADRLRFGYVVDFLYFSLIDFPVFNFADCCVCVGAALGIVLLFTQYRDDELGFLRK